MYRIGQAEADAVKRVIEKKDFFKINKSYQESLHAEDDLQRIFGVKNSILMTSGHAALVSALVGMGVGPGDEVIVPGYTYISTALAVVGAGAIPVIAEVDETLTLDVADFEKKITPRTKAVIPVHIQGFPCDMDGIMEVAKKHNVMVLEDACQADGGSYKGTRLGTIGDAGALSFNYYKVITSGEGGALLTNRDDIFERAFIYHDSGAVCFFGNQMDYVTIEPFCGTEYRTNDITAAIIRVQLERMDGILADLRKNKKIMVEALSDCFKFAPSYDAEGDCGTTIALSFDTEEEARKFATHECVADMKLMLPIDTGKHVYRNWKAIMEKRGALHPAMDPFKMEANKLCEQDYREDMCPKTLEILARTVYVAVKPDDTEEVLQDKITRLRAAMN